MKQVPDKVEGDIIPFYADKKRYQYSCSISQLISNILFFYPHAIEYTIVII